jgi:uncharacterized protein (DUF58 family)
MKPGVAISASDDRLGEHDAPSAATLPSPESLARGNFEMVVRRLADDLALGADNSLFLGGGLEYASSRPYQPGDSVRLLNWRLTARTGKPFIKEYEALKRTSVYIVIDTSASMAVASTPVSKHDLAVWIGAAVGLLAQRRMSPVAFIGAGERSVRLVPSLAPNDLWQAIEPLRLARYDERTTLGERLTQLRPRLGRASHVLVISDLHDATARRAMRELAQRHDVATVHTIDPAEVTPLRAGFLRAEESETGREFIGRSSSTSGISPTQTRFELARAGIDCLLQRTDEPFIAPLRRFLSTRASLARGTR